MLGLTVEHIWAAAGMALIAFLATCAKRMNTKHRRGHKPFIGEVSTSLFISGIVFCGYMYLRVSVWLAILVNGFSCFGGVRSVDGLKRVFTKGSGFDLDGDPSEKK